MIKRKSRLIFGGVFNSENFRKIPKIDDVYTLQDAQQFLDCILFSLENPATNEQDMKQVYKCLDDLINVMYSD